MRAQLERDRVVVTADEFVAYLRSDTERWAAVVKAAGIKAE